MSAANPTYADVVEMLNTLVPLNDPNIDDAPHQAFWRTMNRDQFVQFNTSAWNVGVTGPLVVAGNPSASYFFLALSGLAPFDGTSAPQMPDTASDPDANPATPANLALVETWIKNGAPA
ncbi:MAG: hypothetical protein WAV18_04665 [Roseiarcus sp.]